MRITGLFRPLSTQNEHRSPRNGARFLCFRKKVPFAAMAARREWRAAERDVAQVREGVETSPRESERRGRCVEETRVLPERGVGWWGVAWTACGNERQFAPRHPKPGIKIASERHNRRRCHAPHSPPCESQSHREAEGWESAHRAGKVCGDNARKRNEGAGLPDRRPRFRHNGTSPDRAHTSTVLCRPPHGAPNGARQRWKARETPCCAPSCPNAPRSRPAKGRNRPPPMRAAPADAPQWDECRGARVFFLREWS